MSNEAHPAWLSILEEEESQWQRGHLQFDNGVPSAPHPPTILEQCHNIGNLHGYFSNLESRKCCLRLASVNTTFSNMRLVNEHDTNESVSITACNQASKKENGRLNDKDFWVYRSALFCSTFPVLSVPDPPSEVSPVFLDSSLEHNANPLMSPVAVFASTSSQHRPPSTQDLFDSIRYKFQTSLSDIRSHSDSLTSGIESSESGPETMFSSRTTCDGDDIAVLAPEVLTDWLRKVFYLSTETSRAYEKKIFEPFRKKTLAKILVEELCRQLSLLESDTHPFYNSRMFLSREAYGRWQQKERARISHMISKFWHHSLPPVKNSTHLDVAQYHEDYKNFLHKLVLFENYLRKSNGSTDEGPQLSSASRRLLKEYALRYGIRDLYEKIMRLELLSESFSNAPAFVQQVVGELCDLKNVLPRRMAKSAFNNVEYGILLQTLNVLQNHCKRILTRIKCTYEHCQILIGVGGVIHLLALLVEVRSQLDIENNPTLAQLLELYTKENLHSSYERHKFVAMTDLEIDPRSADITPKLINRLILNIKDEVLDYQRSYAQAYQRYMDVVKFAGSILYDLLMEDVTNFCVTTNQQKNYPGINLAVLGVAYRLDQLDRDPQWLDLILYSRQTWRKEFYATVLHWVKMIEKHAQRFVLQSVGTDTYLPLKLNEDINTADIFPESRCTSTNSQMSLAPSEFSAFSAVTSYRSLQIPIAALQVCNTSEEDNEEFTKHMLNNDQCVFKQVINDNNKLHKKVPISIHSKTISTLSVRVKSRSISVPTIQEEGEYIAGYISKSCDDTVLTDAGYFTGIDFRQDEASIGLEDYSNGLDTAVKYKKNPQHDYHKEREISQNHRLESDDVDSLNGEIFCEHLAESTPLKYKDDDTGPFKDVIERKSHTHVAAHMSNIEKSETIDKRYTKSPITNSVFRQLPVRSLVELGLPEVQPVPNIKTTLPKPAVDKDQERGKDDLQSILDHSDKDTNKYGRTLLVSSSLVEIVFLVKRMIHSVKLFCDTFYPLKMLSINVCDMDEELILSLKQHVIMRWKLVETLKESISSIIGLYCNNLLCIDVCGETNSIARAVIGSECLEELKKYYKSKLVWGCRHKINEVSCHMYHNKKAQYLADKFEPIVLEMSTRINNILELSQLMNELFSLVRQSLCLDLTIKTAAKFHVELTDESQQLCNATGMSLKQIWKGMVNLVVYRMNLFTREALKILHELEVPDHVTMETLYQPVINFLKNHAVVLKQWMHKVAFRSLVKKWWKSFVKMTEDLVKRLIENEEMTITTAKRLLQLIAHVMKFLCGRQVKLDLDFAEKKMEVCSNTLNLCTTPTLQLIVIYHLLTYQDIQQTSNEEDNPVPPRWYLLDMYKDLHHTRKCFTGVQLISWIISHPLENLLNRSDQKHSDQCQGTTESEPPVVNKDDSKLDGSKIIPSDNKQAATSSTQLDMDNIKENVEKTILKSSVKSAAIKIASNLLRKGVIISIDWTPFSSILGSMPDDIYPNIVHYSTSSRQTPNLGAHGSWAGVSGDHCVTDALKQGTSAPHFTLGLASPLDVALLKAELQRQLESKLYSGYSESSDDSQDKPLVLSSLLRENIEESIRSSTPDGEHSQEYGSFKNNNILGDLKPILAVANADLYVENQYEQDINKLEDSLDTTSSNDTMQDEDIAQSKIDFTAPGHSNFVNSPSKTSQKDTLSQSHKTNNNLPYNPSLSNSTESLLDSLTFQDTEASLYRFTDGSEYMNTFFSRLTSHIGEDFKSTLVEEIQHLQNDNYCFGFQYQNLQPEFILKILNARRHQDLLARKFLIPAQQHSEYGLLQESASIGCFGFF